MAKRKTPYRSKVKIGVDAQGKDINKWIQGHTKAELAQAREAVIAHYITGEAPEADRLFGDYASEWFRVRKEPFVSASTRESYRTALNKHLFPVLGERMLRAITPLELQELLNTYAGKSKTTITSIIATLHGVFSSALADRIVSRDPTERLTRPAASPTAIKPTLTAQQRAALAATCETEPVGRNVPRNAHVCAWVRSHLNRPIAQQIIADHGRHHRRAAHQDFPSACPCSHQYRLR